MGNLAFEPDIVVHAVCVLLYADMSRNARCGENGKSSPNIDEYVITNQKGLETGDFGEKGPLSRTHYKFR